MRRQQSHGNGRWTPGDFGRLGEGTHIEATVLVFHAGNVEIGAGVYIGHHTILKGYHKNRMVIGDECWIGEQCYFHAAGGITIGCKVGIGPGVKILTSHHAEEGIEKPIIESRIDVEPVEIGDHSDVGIGAIILPGVTIGRGVQVGAGAVVTCDLPDYAVAAGVPARLLRKRG